MNRDYLTEAAAYATRKAASKPKRSYTEDKIQTALVDMAALHENQYPALRWLHSTPNEHAMNARINPRTGNWYCPGGQRLNRLGRKAGVWDLFLPAPRTCFAGMWLETKSPGGRLTFEQHVFGEAMAMAGYYCVIYDDWQVAWQRMLDYLDRRIVRELDDGIDDTRS